MLTALGGPVAPPPEGVEAEVVKIVAAGAESMPCSFRPVRSTAHLVVPPARSFRR